MIRWALLALALLIGSARAETVSYGPLDAVTATGGTTARTLADRANDQLWAPDFGSCTWDATHDVGACVNAAIAQAVTLGGRTVVIPAGTYGLSTPLVQNTSGVHLEGGGTGAARDSIDPSKFLAVTRLVWIGAAGATMLDIEPASLIVPSLYSADVRGIVFDCASLANICVKIVQTSHSKFDFAVSEPRMTGAWLTTSLTADAPGNQNNDIWIDSRSTNAAYSPTGILLDGTANWNTSYNRFFRLFAWYYKGDGIVFANSDNNVVMDLRTYPNPGATGTPVVMAAPGYTMPNGLATGSVSPPYTTRILHTGSFVSVQGFNSASVWTPGGGNTGTAARAPVTLATNATTGQFSNILHFASTTGVAVGMSATCGGISSGIPDPVSVSAVSGTSVSVNYPALSTVANATSCVFSHGFSASAIPGTYTLTATAAATYNLTAPAGGTNRTGLTVSGGVLNGFELVVPMSGSASVGDTFTATASLPPSQIGIEQLDKANSVPTPNFAIGSTGYYIPTTGAYPQQATAAGIYIGGGIGTCGGGIPSASGLSSFVMGNCGGIGATGTYSMTLGGVGNTASGFGGATVGGHNNTTSGAYALAMGESATASGGQSMAFGETVTALGNWGSAKGGYSTDRSRYATDCWGSGQLAAQGDAQTCVGVLRATGNSTTVVRLTADQAAAGAANCINIPNNTAYSLLMTVTAFDHTTVTKNEVWPLWTGLMTRGANAASTSLGLNTTPVPVANGVVTGSLIAATADTTNGCLNISFTPPTANTDTWNVVARVETVEVQ